MNFKKGQEKGEASRGEQQSTVGMIYHPLMIFDAALRVYGHPQLLRVAEAINGRAGCAVATVHTVTSLFSRPHKANKRLFGPGKIEVERERHLTKAEQEQAKIARIKAQNAILRKQMASERRAAQAL